MKPKTFHIGILQASGGLPRHHRCDPASRIRHILSLTAVSPSPRLPVSPSPRLPVSPSSLSLTAVSARHSLRTRISNPCCGLGETSASAPTHPSTHIDSGASGNTHSLVRSRGRPRPPADLYRKQQQAIRQRQLEDEREQRKLELERTEHDKANLGHNEL